VEKLKEGVKKEMEKNEELNRRMVGVSEVNERYGGQVRQLEGEISSINQLLEQA
jgi:predicted  nucleic acid-binding Zn-ribbon protein